MKRELAALETKSPIKSPMVDSIGRKTRASTRSSGAPLSGSLVYKRVKRSHVKKAELLSNGDNGVSDDVSKENGGVGKQNGVHDEGDEVEKGLVVLEESGNGVAAGVCSEVVKEVCDEGVKKSEDSMAAEEGVKESEDSMVVEEDGVKDVLPISVIVMGVTAVDGVMSNVKSNDVEVNNGLVEEEEGSKKGGNAELGDDLHGNGGSIEVYKEKVVKGKKSALKGVNGNAKSNSVEYPRRFTRSALKSKVDTVAVGSEIVENGENTKVVGEEFNGEVRSELAIVVYQTPESKEEVKVSPAPKFTRRLTRSASKSKVEGSTVCPAETVTLDSEKGALVVRNDNAECDMDKLDEEELSSATPRRKLEMKMSKQISPTKTPTTVLELFGTGMLEGCPVYYDGGKGRELHGRIRGIGILCSCGTCKGMKVIPPSMFEIHACNTYKRAVQYIYLENGRSLIQILKACKNNRFNSLAATVQNAIGPLPDKKVIVCQNCKESFSTMDAESSEPVCSTCVMSNLSPIGPVYSSRKRSRSSNVFLPCQAASACDVVQDGSEQKGVQKSPKASRTPKLKTSQVDLPSDMLQSRRRPKSVKKSADGFVTPTLRRSSRVEKNSETKTSAETVKRSEEASMVPNTSSSPVLGSSEAKHRNKLKKRSFKSALSPKPSKSTRMEKCSPRNDGAKSTERLKKRKKESLTPKPSRTPALRSSEKKSNGKITRKDLRLHKLVFEDDVLPEGTELGYYARGQKLLDGYKEGSGIHCNCCDTVVSASQFEAHAGCASRRKPYCYIYTSNGVSLHELSVTLIKDRRHSAKYNDDLCSICADGGSLLLCDGCPRAFHKECASLPSIPVGKWYCKYCENMFEREKFVAHNANAVAAGRVSGVDSIEQITKRSIRIVNNLASEVSACILCRGHDFSKSGFGPRTIILCDQCEKEYHVGCLKDHNMADLTELPEGKWFCSVDCGKIESSLQNLLVRGVEKLPEYFLDIIRKKSMRSDSRTKMNVSWRLLTGKIATPETRTLLSQAVAIFHESFAPIIDVVSGHDLIPAMVYGRNVGGQEYGGMYCAVLTVNSVVVSAGIFRIFGPEVAELPLVATSSGNHGKGYFQILFACIEKLLAFLKVKTIVLPAADEAGSIWTDRFGFTKMTSDQICELKRNFWSMVRFQGTSMLHKLVPESPVTES